MTVLEAIGTTDELAPNVYTQTEKLSWLSELDGRIKIEVVDTHAGGTETPFSPYSPQEHQRELLVSAPYDKIYPLYLQMQIHYYDGETTRYNNAAALFAAAYGDFTAWYNRTHLPEQRGRRF